MKLIGKEELLPTHYTEVGEPSYTGKGNHSVIQLEEIAEQYKELVHQLRLREQAILNKFSIAIVSESDFPKEREVEERCREVFELGASAFQDCLNPHTLEFDHETFKRLKEEVINQNK